MNIKRVNNTFITINQYSSLDETTLSTADFIVSNVKKVLLDGIPVLLMLSGGSGINVAKNLDFRIDIKYLKNLTITVTDERVVIGKDNNFENLIEVLPSILINNVRFIDTSVKSISRVSDVGTHSKRFEKQLHAWIKQNPTGKIVALLGIGADGHTAGILPFDKNPALETNNEKWIVGYAIDDYYKNPDTINEHHYRTTITFPFILNKIDMVVVYAVGENKKQVLRKIVTEEGDVNKMPSRIFRERKGETQIFTDQII